MNKNTRPSRARITEKDALYLAFLSKFPAADAEALSYLSLRESNPFGAPEGELTDPSGITKRMLKLTRLGAVNRHRSVVSGTTHYGVTEFGHEATRHYGYDIPAYRSIDGLHISTLEHHRCIALTAAKFASPIGAFKETLGIDPVPLDLIISEKEIDRAYVRTRDKLKTLRDSGKDHATFPLYRKTALQKMLKQVTDGTTDARYIIRNHPEFLTVSTPSSKNGAYKDIHKPDLALRLDDIRRQPTGTKAKNWMCEIELSSKTADEYERIMRTLRADLSEGTTYEKVIYFTGTKGIANALRQADDNAGTGLIDARRLHILTIEGRQRRNQTVTVPSTPPATVTTAHLPSADTIPMTSRGLPRHVPSMTNAPVIGGE